MGAACGAEAPPPPPSTKAAPKSQPSSPPAPAPAPKAAEAPPAAAAEPAAPATEDPPSPVVETVSFGETPEKSGTKGSSTMMSEVSVVEVDVDPHLVAQLVQENPSLGALEVEGVLTEYGADVEGAKAEIAARAKQKADEQELRVFKRSVDILSGRFPLATKEEVEEALRDSQNKTAFAMKMLGRKYPKAPPSPFSTGRAPIRKKKSNEAVKAVPEESPTESSQKGW
jgi:hypothetical protein